MSNCRLIRMNLMSYSRSVNTSIIGDFAMAPFFDPTNTNHANCFHKNTFGALFRKTTQNALQYTVQCNAPIAHFEWPKYGP